MQSTRATTPTLASTTTSVLYTNKTPQTLAHSSLPCECLSHPPLAVQLSTKMCTMHPQYSCQLMLGGPVTPVLLPLLPRSHITAASNTPHPLYCCQRHQAPHAAASVTPQPQYCCQRHQAPHAAASVTPQPQYCCQRHPAPPVLLQHHPTAPVLLPASLNAPSNCCQRCPAPPVQGVTRYPLVLLPASPSTRSTAASVTQHPNTAASITQHPQYCCQHHAAPPVLLPASPSTPSTAASIIRQPQFYCQRHSVPPVTAARVVWHPQYNASLGTPLYRCHHHPAPPVLLPGTSGS